MGRKRKNPKREGTNISLDTSDDSSSSKPEKSILAADFKQILEIVKENGNKLDSLCNQLGTLTTGVDNLDKEHSALKNKMVNSESQIGKIENDASCLNLQLKICTDELIKKLKRKNEDSMCRIVKLEAAKLENNIIIWNAVCDDIDNTKALFSEVVRHRLELPEVNFTISQYDRNRKFLKVILHKKDDKFSIIKMPAS